MRRAIGRLRVRLLIAAVILGACAAPPTAGGDPAQRCAALTRAELPAATVTTAEFVSAGDYTAPDGEAMTVPAFCRVHGTATPVPGSNIGFEVWVPAQERNGRLVMFGNGGYSSDIDFPSMGRTLAAGYATVGTDTGHTGDDPDVFVQGAANPEIIVDWGHRAVHESVVNAKLLVRELTGDAPSYSYFVGCSTGGHQALMEAQRYPDDFDGIVAGAPGNNRIDLNAGFLWQFLTNHRRGDNTAQILPASKLSLLSETAVRQCRGRDGGLATDDFLTDPASCRFDPATLLCRGADQPSCLTADQVEAVRAMYAGARDPRTGAQVYPGWPLGSEAPSVDQTGKVLSGWSGYWGSTEPARANFWRYWVFNDPNWDWWTFDYDRDLAEAHRKLGPVIDATDPDLRPFRDSGGKLLMYQGWADPVVSAHDTIDYYRQVVQATSAGPADSADAVQQTQSFARLFLVPGMAHCSGGPGPAAFSPLDPLVRWAEQDDAPTRITATKHIDDNPGGGTAFTRELRPYPAAATPPS